MNEIKLNMIKKAMDLYQEIHPCSSKAELLECFTCEENGILFWFNTNDHSTHVLVEMIAQ
jgi:hypothetical protein